MRPWFTLVLCAACAAVQPVAAPAPVMKPPEPVVVAKPVLPPAEVQWTAPAPTVAAQPERPQTGACLDESEGARLGEQWRAWRHAKLEAVLSKRGLLRLAGSKEALVRGGPMLLVRRYEGCGEPGIGDYAMDSQHRVHPVLVEFRAKLHTTVTLCGCGPRCGGQAMSFKEYVLAPKDATLGEAVSVVVVLDEDVVATQEDVCPPMP